VVDASTGRGVSGARIRIQSGQDDPLFTTADARGHFQLAGLELKSYQVTGRYPGLFDPKEANGLPGGGMVRLDRTLPNGQIRLELRHYGAIEGKVTDALGAPVPGATVEALHRYPVGEQSGGNVYRDGGYQYSGRPRAQTNDLGEYRIAPLAAGSYYIYVPAQPMASYYSRQPEIRAQSDPRDRSTFYPNALKGSESKPVDLAEGKELRADVRIVRQGGVKISGRIFGLTAMPPGSYPSVFIRGMSPAASNVPVNVTGDRFTAADVLPGKYVVGVGQYPAGDTYGQDLRAAARQTIEVGTEAVDGVDLTLAAAPELHGAVVFESGCAAAPVWMQLMGGLGTYAARNLQTDAGGRFALHLFPDKYKAYVGVEGVPRASARSLKLSDAEVLADGFEVTAETTGPLRITMTCLGR